MLTVGVTVALTIVVVSLGGVVLLVTDRGHHGHRPSDPWPPTSVSPRPPRGPDGSFLGAIAPRAAVVRQGWLVMWSPWRQAYTAVCCFAPEPVIVDGTSAHRVHQRMAEAEAHFALCAA